MKIEMRKVTWYSKLLALILFILLPFIGFWFGMEYERVLETLENSPATVVHFPYASKTLPPINSEVRMK